MAHVQAKDVPLMFLLVGDPASFGLTGQNVAGISPKIPGNVQLVRFKELLPDRRVFALIYNPTKNSIVAEEAQTAAREGDIQLELVAVNSPAEMCQRFDRIKNVVDAVWIVPDESFATRTEVWDVLVKQTTDLHLPFLITQGEPFVARGALATLVPDYRDIGRQCGELVRQIETGKAKLADIGIQAPDMVRLVLNTNTAKRIDITVPRQILESPSTKIYP